MCVCVCEWHIVEFFRQNLFDLQRHSGHCCVLVWNDCICNFVAVYIFNFHHRNCICGVLYSFRKLSDSRLDPIGCIHTQILAFFGYRLFLASFLFRFLFFGSFNMSISSVFIYFKKLSVYISKLLFIFRFPVRSFFPSKYLSCILYLNKNTNIRNQRV